MLSVIALATLLNTLLTLPPTLVMAAMAATEISEAISTYSIAVAPCSFFISLRKMDSMIFSWGPAGSGLSSGREETLAQSLGEAARASRADLYGLYWLPTG